MSNYTKKFLEKFYSKDRVVQIVHGIDLSRFTNYNLDKKSNEKLSFIYIGYLDDIHKGVDVLVKAIDNFLEKNKNLKISFEFCGIGPLEPIVKDLESKYPLIVEHHGYISNDLIPEYYKKSDVFLFSSRVEPFPRSIMEALGAKLIILSSLTIGSVELLKGREFAFFIKQLNPRSLEEKFSEIYALWYKNPQKIRELQEKAYIYVKENYSTDLEILMFRNLINKILKISN